MILAPIRFWSKVNFTDSCWLWTGVPNEGGYGQFYVSPKYHVRAHRWAYEFCVGPITEGLVLDHLCDTPSCVFPDHLEPVTQRVNTLRGRRNFAARNARVTHCPAGHPYDFENTYIHPADGGRICRACKRELRARIREEAA